jgi:hypothetical protein
MLAISLHSRNSRDRDYGKGILSLHSYFYDGAGTFYLLCILEVQDKPLTHGQTLPCACRVRASY